MLHLIAISLIILAHRRDVARIRLIFYLPVVFLMLTLGQFENILFGYEISWCLAIAALAAAIFLWIFQGLAGLFSSRPSEWQSSGATPHFRDF